MSLSLQVCDKKMQPVKGVCFDHLFEQMVTRLNADSVNGFYLLNVDEKDGGQIRISHPDWQEVNYDFKRIQKLNGKKVFLGDKGDSYFENHATLIPFSNLGERVGVVPSDQSKVTFDRIFATLNRSGWQLIDAPDAAPGGSILIGCKTAGGVDTNQLLKQLLEPDTVRVAGPLINSLWGFCVLSNIISVSFRNGTGKETIDLILRQQQLVATDYNKSSNAYLVRAPEIVGEEIISIANKLLLLGEIEFADVEVFMNQGYR